MAASPSICERDPLEQQEDGTYLCPSGKFVNIGARMASPKTALCELCPSCPTMEGTMAPSHSPSAGPIKWTARGGPEYMNNKIVMASGSVDESGNTGPDAIQGGYHFSDEDKDKLLMCPDSYVSKKLKEHILGRKFDDSLRPPDTGSNKEFYWKNKQREIKPEFIRDQIMGHIGDKPVVSGSGGPGSKEDPGARFNKCMAAKMADDLTERELMSELLAIPLNIYEDCLETLDTDKCDQGFSGEFTGLHSELSQTNVKLKSGIADASVNYSDTLSLPDKGIIQDRMIQLSENTETSICDKISDNTKILRNTKSVNLEFPDIELSDFEFLQFIKDGDGLRVILTKILNALVILGTIYVVGNIIIQLMGRGSSSRAKS